MQKMQTSTIALDKMTEFSDNTFNSSQTDSSNHLAGAHFFITQQLS